MRSDSQRFYIPYGSLPPDALSYIVRQADDDLLSALLNKEFCYVLTSRQMGKSSLMVRTLERLRENDVAVAVLDLTSIGFNLSAEQWYNGLMDQLGRRLNLQNEMDDYILENEHLSPLQRWQKVLADIVQQHISGQLVIFVDEIDIVRSLSFSVDEFFGAIRACYNARTVDSDFHRLTFCLLGVAAPSDLITNSDLTPFNIGRRIILNDFTPEEASLLQYGLGRDTKINQRLMERILYWTGGHPCLTQRLCMAVSLESKAQTPHDVDRCCSRLFLTSNSIHQDDNLEFVCQRLLFDEEDISGLLLLYEKVSSRKPIPDDETIPFVTRLKLSGVVTTFQVKLKVRNRIYKKVFDQDWIKSNLPGQEIQRQKAAYRRGILRSTVVFGTISLIMVVLTFVAVQQTRLAKQEKLRAEDLVYAADMSDVQKAWEANDVGNSVQLLQNHLRDSRKSWEWRHFWQLSHNYVASLAGHKDLIFTVAYSPDGKMVASGSFDGTVKLWDAVTHRNIWTIDLKNKVFSVAFSPNSKIIAAASIDHSVKLWDVTDHLQIAELNNANTKAMSLAFSPNGKTLAIGYGEDPNINGIYGIILWDIVHYKKIGALIPHQTSINSICFSPDGKYLASGDYNGLLSIWDVARQRVRFSHTYTGEIHSVSFSPDGRLLACGDTKGYISLWKVPALKQINCFQAHKNVINSVQFSRDNMYLASASWDSTIRLWSTPSFGRVKNPQPIGILKGHTDMVNSVAFSPDGSTIVSGSNDHTLKFWHIDSAPLTRREEMSTLKSGSIENPIMALSPDNRSLIVCGSKGKNSLWDISTRTRKDLQLGSFVNSVAFSEDGKLFATGNNKGECKLWDSQSLFEIKRISLLAPILSLTFSPDNSRIAIADNIGNCKLWDISVKSYENTLSDSFEPQNPHKLLSIAFSPNGRILATGGNNNVIRLWDVATLKVIATLLGHTNDVLSVAFSPDGKTLASSSWDRTIIFWDVATHERIGILKGHTNRIPSVAFSRDGKTLASGSWDGTIKLWNILTQRNVATLQTGLSQINSVAFSKDDQWLAACGDKGTVKLWRAAGVNEIKD